MDTKQILITSHRHDALGAHTAFFESRGFTVKSRLFSELQDEGFHTYTPNIILIDIFRPEPAVYAICRQLRSQFAQPILLLCCESDERFHIELYEHGVDESIIKPIGIDLLLAKVNAWLARADVTQSHKPKAMQCGFRINKSNRQVTTPAGNAVRLSKLEFELLTLFLCHPNRILEPELIGRRVWDYDDMDTTKMVKNLVYRLRNKIERDPARPRYILTTEGLGYAFAPE